MKYFILHQSAIRTISLAENFCNLLFATSTVKKIYHELYSSLHKHIVQPLGWKSSRIRQKPVIHIN